MLTWTVAVASIRLPTNVGSGSTNLGTLLPSSGACGVLTEGCPISPVGSVPGAALHAPTSPATGTIATMDVHRCFLFIGASHYARAANACLVPRRRQIRQ